MVYLFAAKYIMRQFFLLVSLLSPTTSSTLKNLNVSKM